MLRLHFVGEELEAQGRGVTCSRSQQLLGTELRTEIKSEFPVHSSLFYHLATFHFSLSKLRDFLWIDAHSRASINTVQMFDVD